MAGVQKYKYILTFNGNSETLTVNPAGWDKIGLSRVRSKVYHSVSRSLTLSLRFANVAGGGYQFIRNAYNSAGIYANIEVIIKKRNHNTNGYDLFYEGKLDLNPGRFTISRNYIECSIIDSQKLQRLFARDEINFNLFSLISADNVNITPFVNDYQVNLTPIDIVLEGQYTCNSYANFPLTTGTQYTYFNNKTDIVNQIGDRVTIDGSERVYVNNTSLNIDLDVTLNSSVEWTGYAALIQAQTQINLYDQFDVLVSSQVHENLVSLTDFSLISSKNLTYSYVDVTPGSYIILRTIISGVDWVFNQKDDYTITFKEQYDGYNETSTKCLFPHEAFSRLIQLTTSETDTTKLFYSEIMGRTDSEFVQYNSNGSIAYDAIFSGLLCRNFPNATLTVSLIDLFKTFDSIYNLGFGYDYVNDRFYIAEKAAFFDSDYFMFDLGEVADLQISPLDDGYFSKLIAGFDNTGEYEDLQGAYEFNNKREYLLPAPVETEKNIQSKYRTDSVGIEVTRKKQYKETSSEDTKEDNNIFIVKTDGVEPIIVEDVTGFNGCENYYNLDISPRQNVVRWGNALMPSMYKNNGIIQQTKSDKLFELHINGIDENSDISQSELASPLFIPELYSFEASLTDEQIEILIENPHGFITFSYLGENFEGFVDEITVEDKNNKATFKLIAKAESDLRNFIFFDDNDFVFFDDNDFIFFN